MFNRQMFVNEMKKKMKISSMTVAKWGWAF